MSKSVQPSAVMFCLLAMVMVVGGFQLATGQESTPAEPQPAPVQPEQSLPEPEVHSTLVSICGPSLTNCPTILCQGECYYSVYGSWREDLGVRCCNDDGTTFECPVGKTVHRVHTPCSGDECISVDGYQHVNYCD